MALYLPEEFSKNKQKHKVFYSERPKDETKTFTEGQFESFTGMRYLPQLAFNSKSSFQKIKKKCLAQAPSQKALWMGAQYGKQIEEGHIAALKICFVSNSVGWGLFATAPIEAGDFIGEYTGHVRPISILGDKLNPYCFRYPLYGWRFIYYTIDGQEAGNEMSFMNHSDSANCKSTSLFVDGFYHIAVLSSKKIAAGEQLTFDYGKNYWRRFGTS